MSHKQQQLKQHLMMLVFRVFNLRCPSVGDGLCHVLVRVCTAATTANALNSAATAGAASLSLLLIIRGANWRAKVAQHLIGVQLATMAALSALPAQGSLRTSPLVPRQAALAASRLALTHVNLCSSSGAAIGQRPSATAVLPVGRVPRRVRTAAAAAASAAGANGKFTSLDYDQLMSEMETCPHGRVEGATCCSCLPLVLLGSQTQPSQLLP